MSVEVPIYYVWMFYLYRFVHVFFMYQILVCTFYSGSVSVSSVMLRHLECGV